MELGLQPIVKLATGEVVPVTALPLARMLLGRPGASLAGAAV